MAIEVFNRYEIKFIVPDNKVEKIIERMRDYVVADSYNQDGGYTISNIYYDTPQNDIIRKSISKPRYKEKLRLRAYGVPLAEELVFLEIKKKVSGLVNKRRTKIRLQDAYAYLDGGPKPDEAYLNRQVLREIDWFLQQNPVRPTLYLAYDRVAFFGVDDPDFRITFDSNIRTRRHDVRLELGDAETNRLDDGFHVMEVKVNKSMPLWLTHILSDLEVFPSGFSKYGTEYKQYKKEDNTCLIHS